MQAVVKNLLIIITTKKGIEGIDTSRSPSLVKTIWLKSHMKNVKFLWSVCKRINAHVS